MTEVPISIELKLNLMVKTVVHDLEGTTKLRKSHIHWLKFNGLNFIPVVNELEGITQ